eukprot:738573-Lingulodinium_polyedra.AAC.1
MARPKAGAGFWHCWLWAACDWLTDSARGSWHAHGMLNVGTLPACLLQDGHRQACLQGDGEVHLHPRRPVQIRPLRR